MYKSIVEKVGNAAAAKVDLYQSKGRYFVSSILAGVYVGVGILLIFSISGLLGDSSATKIVMGASFGVALSLVVMAGSELFTGNNFVMTVGLLDKKASFKDTVNSWVLCYLGNLTGALIVALVFVLAGLGGESATGNALAGAAVAKASAPAVSLFFRGILCNMMVCLAVLCSIKLENEVAKLIMIWWCLFVFITSGYEHSIANMTIYFAALFTGGATVMQMVFNLVIVTLGNMVGGIALGAAYYYMGSNK
ncbi:formate/nitrite transporter family protein [Mollicutes bacterium LVI A0039]|nr:formate/nitrite transporter family protein [Mollicutes bacterium LVI A0039]